MRSTFTAERNERDMQREFRVVLTDQDFSSLQLSELDRAVLADCDGADRTIADRLLALELIFRRLEQQAKPPRVTGGWMAA